MRHESFIFNMTMKRKRREEKCHQPINTAPLSIRGTIDNEHKLDSNKLKEVTDLIRVELIGMIYDICLYTNML